MGEMVYCCRQQNFVFFEPMKVSNSSSSRTSGISSIDGASGNVSQTCFTQIIMVV
ncbi:hypothetical protein RintRC_6018 [Richelia intracellularis]|nr:hypothetical protein RintRC_6018 [Richelia intracellularis]